MLGLTEEVGLIGGEQIHRHLHLLLIQGEQLEIRPVAIQSMMLQTFRQASGYQRLLGGRHADAGNAENHLLETGEFTVVEAGFIHDFGKIFQSELGTRPSQTAIECAESPEPIAALRFRQ